ncbi:helix-turn-helix domain-containing protein [Ralstonia solanacearum]|uniref:helix-turn-helix domain-containing protein n=2 Tax=Ralstonia solanacearum TaxID=305 RepID=UPI0018B0E0CB|nr:helix-turn-helix transcriptional regulator [Ralstonia solanacearum]
MAAIKACLSKRINHSLYQCKYALRMNTYGERLQTALKLSHQTRTTLAQHLGISEQAIGQVILGSTKALTAENSARAARFLRVDDLWLATGEGEPTDSGATREQSLWPFTRVALDRVLLLPADERAFVEAKLEAELERAEERAKKAGQARGAEPQKESFDPSQAKDEDYFLAGAPAPSRKARKKTG